MPDYPSNSHRFLGQQESILACNKLAADGIALTQGGGDEPIPHWAAFKMTVSDWRVWAQTLLFMLVTGSQTMQYFIPTLMKIFGWEGPSGQCKCPATNAHLFSLAVYRKLTGVCKQIILSPLTWQHSSLSSVPAG